MKKYTMPIKKVILKNPFMGRVAIFELKCAIKQA
jgi:hypothetical protein